MRSGKIKGKRRPVHKAVDILPSPQLLVLVLRLPPDHFRFSKLCWSFFVLWGTFLTFKSFSSLQYHRREKWFSSSSLSWKGPTERAAPWKNRLHLITVYTTAMLLSGEELFALHGESLQAGLHHHHVHHVHHHVHHVNHVHHVHHLLVESLSAGHSTRWHAHYKLPPCHHSPRPPKHSPPSNG